MQKGKVVETIRDLTLAKDPYTKKLLASIFTIEEGKNKVLPDELLPKCYGNVKAGFIKSRFCVSKIGYRCISEWNLIVLQVNEYIFTNGKRNKRILRQYDDNCRRIHNGFIDKLL